ncbi:MAG: hypothetical protein Q4D38_08745 [Planctomycetia bacterium]|nr:hypothetical protein [Planctomycetia bacterium]
MNNWDFANDDELLSLEELERITAPVSAGEMGEGVDASLRQTWLRFGAILEAGCALSNDSAPKNVLESEAQETVVEVPRPLSAAEECLEHTPRRARPRRRFVAASCALFATICVIVVFVVPHTTVESPDVVLPFASDSSVLMAENSESASESEWDDLESEMDWMDAELEYLASRDTPIDAEIAWMMGTLDEIYYDTDDSFF